MKLYKRTIEMKDASASEPMKMGKAKTGGNLGTPKKSGLILSPARPAGKSR